MTLRRVVLVAHHERTESPAHAAETAAWCAKHEADFWMPPDDAVRVGLGDCASDRPVHEADVIVSLGGDGTMLRSVELLDGHAVPLIGVNLGSLGYLTEVEPDDLTDALDRFALGDRAGEWRIDERMMLDVVVNGVLIGRALNEAVVEKNQSGHTRAVARPHRRRPVHALRGGRVDRLHTDRVDGVLAVGSWPDRVATASGDLS